MDDKSLVIIGNNTENMTFVEACLTHHVSDDLQVRFKTDLGVEVYDGTDIINIDGRLPTFSIDIFSELVHVID